MSYTRHRRSGPVSIAIALSLTAVTSCSGSSAAAVVVAPAVSGSIQVWPAGAGILRASIDHGVTLERRATVASIDVVEGAAVTAGQQVMSVYTIGNSAAVTTAINELRADEQALAIATTRDGVLAATTILLSQAVAQDRQTLTDLKFAPTPVLAPVNGTVSALNAQVGVQASRTDVVMHVVDETTLQVEAQVPAAYRSLLTVGDQAEISLRDSGAQLAATLDTIGATAAEVDSTSPTSTIPVVVEFANPEKRLALGTPASVRFSVNRQAAVTVNSLAVLGQSVQPFVFVVNHGVVRQQPVVIGVTDGSDTEIVSGVAPGDEVVISGGQRLIDGERVESSRSRS